MTFTSSKTNSSMRPTGSTVKEDNEGAMDTALETLLGWANEMEGRSAMEMMVCGVSSLTLLTERSMKMVAHVEPHLKHLHKVKAALCNATEKGKMAALNLKHAISSSSSELGTVYALVNHIKQKKTSYMWFIFKRFHLKKALPELEKVNCSLNACSLLTSFDAAVDAYEGVIKLCKKYSRSCRKSSMLQAACYASVAILKCVRVGVIALQASPLDIGTVPYDIVSTAFQVQLDAAVCGPLQNLITILDNKRKNIISTTQASRSLLQEVQREMKNLQIDSQKIKLSLDALKEDLHIFPKYIELAKRMRSFDVLLDPVNYKILEKHRNDLVHLQDSCDQLINKTQQVYDCFKNESSKILQKN